MFYPFSVRVVLGRFVGQGIETTVLTTESSRDYPTPPALFSPPGTIMLPELQL
jgi:hypothetical protein